jgi:hypothetical protein
MPQPDEPASSDRSTRPNDIDLQMTRTVAGAPPTIGAMWNEMKDQGAKLDMLIGVIIRAPFDRSPTPTLYEKIAEISSLQGAHTNHLKNHEDRITKSENDEETKIKLRAEFAQHGVRLDKHDQLFEDIKKQNETKGEKLGERVWGWGQTVLALLFGAAVSALFASRTLPPPGH